MVGNLVKFPSEEWINLFMEALNANKNYEDAAKTWEGDFLFLIEPDGSMSESSTFYVDLWHGKRRGVAFLKLGEQRSAAFVYSEPYGNWKRLMNKEIDPI
jgi:putative sterol carrier protein